MTKSCKNKSSNKIVCNNKQKVVFKLTNINKIVNKSNTLKKIKKLSKHKLCRKSSNKNKPKCITIREKFYSRTIQIK